MEEEIITPEEETFDYSKLRYILDKDGYIFHASIGGLIICDLGECTEYIGEVPEGYETIEEWYEEELEKINAWKIVEGNLVFDENKYNELKAKWQNEENENSCASKKYVNDKLNNVNTIYDDELSSNIEGFSLFTIENTKDAEIAEMNITPNKAITDNLKIKITNENMLGNNALNKEENGLSFEVNEDKSITINGTATADTEYIINGSLTNTDILFFLKNNQDYMQCGLPEGVSLNLYNFDGVDRSLVSSLGNGTINLSTTAYITYVTLSIVSGTKFKKVKVYPMIQVGTYSNDTEYEYIQCEENEIMNIDLGEYTFENDDDILIDRTSYTFTKNIYLYPSDDLYPGDDLYPIDYDEIIEGIVETQKSFKNKTLIQCDKDVSFKVKYFPNDYLNEKFSQIQIEQDEIKLEIGKKVGNDEIISKINLTREDITIDANRINFNGAVSANGNFLIDTEGNMECNKATMTDVKINGGNINMIGDDITPAITVKDNSGDEIEMYPSNINMTYNYLGETIGIFLQKGGIYLESDNGNYINLNVSEGYIEIKSNGNTKRITGNG